jgi:hypothetical protein
MVPETNSAFPNLPGLRAHLAAPSLAAQLTDAALAVEGGGPSATRLDAIVTAELAAAREHERGGVDGTADTTRAALDESGGA